MNSDIYTTEVSSAMDFKLFNVYDELGRQIGSINELMQEVKRNRLCKKPELKRVD